MALDVGAQPPPPKPDQPTRPLPASLRWGLGWTVIAATIPAARHGGGIEVRPVEKYW